MCDSLECNNPFIDMGDYVNTTTPITFQGNTYTGSNMGLFYKSFGLKFTTTKPSPQSSQSSDSSKLSGGAIAGIVLGSVAFVGIVSFLVYFFVFRSKSEEKSESKPEHLEV